MTIIIPSRYEDITLGQYLDWYNASSDMHRFQIISGLSEEKSRDVPVSKIREALELFEAALSNTSGKFIQRIDIGATSYGIIPNFTKITGGEFADLMHYTSPEQIQKDLAKAMCVLYRPVTAVLGKTYEIERYDGDLHMLNESDMRTLTMDKVEGVLLFFSTIAKELVEDSLTFLEATNEMMKEKMNSSQTQE